MSDQIPDSATRRTFHRSVVDEFLANGGKVGGRAQSTIRCC